MSKKHGIVISPPFEVVPQGGIQCGGSPSPEELRKYLLYWDKIDYPDNNFISIGTSTDIQFLVSADVATRTMIRFQGSVLSGSGEFFVAAQQAAFDKHDKEEPGLWSLAQPAQTPYFVGSKASPAIEYQLWNMLPVPTADVPLEDILSFKEKRKDEMLVLRVYLNEMYESIIAAEDLPREKNLQIEKLELALSEVNKTLGEENISKSITTLRGYIAGEFANMLGVGLGAAGVAPLIGLSPLTAAVIGAGITFVIKPALSPKVGPGSHPLTYVSSIKKEL